MLSAWFVFAAFSLPMAFQGEETMHPPVQWGDSSPHRVCTPCHDVEYIERHNTHAGLAGRDWETRMARLHLRGFFLREVSCQSCHTSALRRPTARECAACHGVCIEDSSLGNPELQGLVFRPDKVRETALNLYGKDTVNRPLDVHAERGMQCSDCHFSLNHPAYYRESDATRPRHLLFDGRKTALSDYLHRPDHHLATGKNFAGASAHSGRMDCDVCHSDVHRGPWRGQTKAHFEKLSCQACHIPVVYTPLLEMVDWTQVDSALNPHKTWRNHTRQGISAGFAPLLLKRETAPGSRYPHGFAYYPFNPVITRLWVYGDSSKPLPVNVVRRVSAGYDSSRISRALEELGYTRARVLAEVTPFPISHGVGPADWATVRCEQCHDPQGLLHRRVSLGAAGIVPELRVARGAQWDGEVSEDSAGVFWYIPPQNPSGVHVPGSGKFSALDFLGMLMVVVVLGGSLTHGVLRLFFAWRRRARGETCHTCERKKTYMYSVYERFWHWLQAFAILVLLMSGAHIRFPDLLPFMAFAKSVHLHSIMGLILTVNAALSLFYHLVGGEIRQFLPEPKGFFSQAIAQQVYYLKGIFRGDPHPFEKSPNRKLNPLQQLAYLALLNILLPLQIFTGILMWQRDYLGAWLNPLGGAAFVAGVHALAAWAFVAFLFMHIYLTTTGERPLDYIRAMVTGWEEHS